MKVTRLFKVPRSTRTIQLVINIPEAISAAPPAPTSPAEQQRPRGSRFAKVMLKFSVPMLSALASVAALIVAIFALNGQNMANFEQQSVDRAAAAQVLQQQAQKVNFVVQSEDSAPFERLSVENTSSSPISNIVFTMTIIYSNGINSTETQSKVWFGIGDLKACQAASIEMADLIEGFITSKLHSKVSVNLDKYYRGEVGLTMYFIDRNAVSWMYPAGGRLQQQNPPDYTATILNPVYKAPSTCS